MLKSEKGMSRVELVITLAIIMLILACTILLSIGEDGLSFLPKQEEVNNNNSVNEEVQNNETNETAEKNEIVPAEDKISNEINGIIDNTVYQ